LFGRAEEYHEGPQSQWKISGQIFSTKHPAPPVRNKSSTHLSSMFGHDRIVKKP
jgi:hypothetical protein